MEIDRSTSRLEGVTFVSVVARNPHDQPARFRLENALDGPVLPPRTRGRPVAGWDESGYEGVIAAGAREGLGYASEAKPRDPPAVIAWVEPAEADPDPAEESPVRKFADPRPPRSVLSPATPLHRTGRPEAGNETRTSRRGGGSGGCP